MPKCYLVNGEYPEKSINLRVHLPAAVDFAYEFSSGFNLSKDVGGELGGANIVGFFMRKSRHNDAPMGTADQQFPHSFTIGSLIDCIEEAIAFNENKTQSYVVLIHNDRFDLELIQQTFRKIDGAFLAEVTPETSPKMLDLTNVHFRAETTPRKVGISIVVKIQ